MSAPLMKIRAIVTVQLDPAAWREVSGQDDVRRDVLDYIESTLQQPAGFEEASADVSVRR
jgi:hypothetical protein